MKKILYIEDDPVSQVLIGKMVDKMGFQMISARTSEEGFERAFAEKPDLILMDIMLPGLDGYETTLKIRMSEELKDIPIVAITAGSNPNDRQFAAVTGCNGYLTKPVEFDHFSKYIRTLIEKPSDLSDDGHFHKEDSAVELRKFTQRLVQRLTEKIQELSESNKKLETAYQRLDKYVTDVTRNNQDLMQFNFVSNQVLTFSNREKVYKELPALLCEKLSMLSAAIYVVNERDMTLDVFSSHHLSMRPDVERISIVKPPFFDMVYYQEPVLIDKFWMQAAERADETMAKRMAPFVHAFHSHTIYFLPITGRPKAEQGFHCENTDCHAFINKDPNWWNKKIYKLDPNSLSFESELRDVSQYYFNCCLYGVKGVLALGIEEGRLNENMRQMVQSFVRTVGLTIENIQLYDDTKEAYLIAERQAITDGLTEIFNYRYFYHQLEREIKRSKRHWYKTSMIMIDIDFFKAYNDTHGHPAGDVVLRKVAEIIKTSTRTSDVVARYGGEEFVLILPETPKTSAIKLAEKIRSLVELEHFPNEETQPNGRLTISLGVATFPDDAQTVDELVQRADQQLYQAKMTGKNKVCVIE